MKQEKISFSSALFLSISSIIGAGIFLKAKKLNELSQNQTTPLIVLFLISLAVIICLSYSLIKIIPLQTTNAGFIEWTQKLCPKWFNKISINFARNIYHPVSLLLFSNYAVYSFSGETKLNSWSVLMFSFLICFIFMTLNLISFKLSQQVQIFLLILVVIPLIILPTIGFLYPGTKNNEIVENPKSNSIGPWLVLISGLPSILFIFDGFYSLSSLKEKLKKPEYLTSCLIISFGIITLLYLYLIIGFNVGDPKNSDYKNFSFFQKKRQFSSFFEILIGCASFLTLNSIALGNVYQLAAINKTHKFKDLSWMKEFLFYKKIETNDKKFQDYFISWIYLVMKTFVWFLIIGIIAQIDSLMGGKNFLKSILDSWADSISILIFMIIAVVILSSFFKINSWNKKNYFFKTASILSSGFIFTTLTYILISYFSNAINSLPEEKITSWFKILSLLFFVIICCIDQIYLISKKWLFRKKYMLFSTKIKDSIITLE